ncbi:MAG TPA: NAD(P)/FAD-dependent oxidoreductase [Steroidobacteraceae bacterium]|jgi:putative flavoprotein involved in K+ transport
MTLSEATHLVEEGAASMQLAHRRAHPVYDVIVIGAGQSGLSAGYHLARTGARFLILEAHARIGDSWRKRWDSLRLFTPAKFCGLDGMSFPAPRNYFPTKDEMADYLEAYARHFNLPVRTGVRVQRLYKRAARFVVAAEDGVELEAAQVIVAMAKYQQPKIPAFAAALASEMTQLHSMDYRSPSQLQPGSVLLVGGGNSGADIALELARTGRETWLAGQGAGEVPFRPERFWGRNLLGPLLLGFVFRHVLTVKTPIGRKARPGILAKGAPRIRVKSRDLAAAGVRSVARVVGARDRRPLLEDGQVLDVRNIIWCGGFHAGFDWIDFPIFDATGDPRHDCGTVLEQPGLYFVGLPFQYAMSSGMIHGVGRDAKRIVDSLRTA